MKPTRSNRPTLRQLISGCSLSAMLFAQNAAAFTVAQTPPFLPTPLPPNIVMTFDDSGSMRFAMAPESICSIETNSSTYGARRTKSSSFNSLYYDPTVTYDPPVNAQGTPLSTSFTQAWVNGFDTSKGSVNLSENYRVTWAYNPESSSNPFPSKDIEHSSPNQCGNVTPNNAFARNNSTDFPTRERKGVPAYYYVHEPTWPGCSSTSTDQDSCYRKVSVGASEQQNFANWFSFYRTRNLLTVASASRAMTGVPPTTRFAWQSLNRCDSFGTSCRDNRIRRFADIATVTTPDPPSTVNHRSNFYSWLFRLPADQGTPLRSAADRVGRYFMTSGNNSPYGIDPNQSPTTSGTEYSCRPNFHIMMTDGLWNDSGSSYCNASPCGNVDGTSQTLPDGKTYSVSATPDLTKIYRDSYSNTLADVAFYYWATDLRDDLTNNLAPYRADRSGSADEQYWNAKNDPATWQHVITFTVGLGLTKTLNLSGLQWAGGTYEVDDVGGAYWNLRKGLKLWPEAKANQSPGNVYDLWHAAINSRGQSFSADTPRDLSDALAKALNRIFDRKSAAAALATSSTRLVTDSMLFQALFWSGTWTGEMSAYAIEADGALGSEQWKASSPGKIPEYDSRRIYSWSGTAGMTFERSSLEAAGLWASIGSDAMLNYLRGDPSNESPNGARYRARVNALGEKVRLGDIVNSDPVFVGTENFGYSSLGTGGASYPAFLTAKKSRLKMLYVGSNDGYLRGFNASNGEEVFAYVPNAVIPNLSLLAKPDYAHRYYVDGSPTAWDAYFGASPGWKTVLIGSTGAGGKSIFALDVTNPAGFDASKVLWEINQNTAYRSSGSPSDSAPPEYDTRLGYTIGQAVVAQLNNGEWAAIFGNGYRSTSEQASLYIVRIADGTLIRRIDTGVGSSAAPNGLGTPTLYDTNGDDIYDVVYAPDMRGNVWKFNLGGGTASAWDVAYKSGSTNVPLFQARNSSGTVQPISARIELASPPVGKPGIMVLFGTGRFFAEGDNTDTTGQTFYGIWDNGSPVTATNRSTLQEQTISTESIDLRGKRTTVRNVASNPVDWTTKRGWYIDLPTSKERVIGAAAVRDNRAIFTTLIPSTDPCEGGGSSWLMEVSAITGAKLPYSVFDTNGDKLVTAADQNISGVPSTVGMVKRPLVVDGSPVAVKFLSGTLEGNTQIERNRTFGPPLGRESWREVQR